MTNAKLSSQPWLIELCAQDNGLAPVITKGQTVTIDCSERDLIDGGIYAVKRDGEVSLWLFHEGFAGVGPLAEDSFVGTLSSLAGTFRCSGPLDIDTVKVIGRLSSDIAEGAIEDLSAQRELLLAALDECRNALRRQSSAGDLGFIDAAESNPSLASWRRRYEEVQAAPELAKRFALEQRIDAISARLMFLEDGIADADAKTADHVATKLQVLWDLHHAPFPSTHGDLAARIVASALRGLNNSEEPPAEPSEARDGPAIKLVSSPRRR